jgi:rhomboid protease GluP
VNLRRTPATTLLIVAILIVFGIQFSIDRANETSVLLLGGIRATTLPQHDYWQLLAAMFLHFGVLHLIMNVWALYQLGGVFEVLFGTKRFLMTYFGTGLAASIVSAIFVGPHTLAAGASGAIFGILGALIPGVRRSPRWRHQPWTRGFLQQLIGWAIINIIIGFSVPGIDNSAHLGGFVAGLLLGFIPHRVPPLPPRESVIEAKPIEPV